MLLCVLAGSHAVAPCRRIAVYRGLSVSGGLPVAVLAIIILLGVPCVLLSSAHMILAFMCDIV